MLTKEQEELRDLYDDVESKLTDAENGKLVACDKLFGFYFLLPSDEREYIMVCTNSFFRNELRAVRDGREARF